MFRLQTLNLCPRINCSTTNARTNYISETVLYNMKRFKLGWGGVGTNMKLKWICSLHHKSIALGARFFLLENVIKDIINTFLREKGLWFNNALYTRMHSNCQKIMCCTSPLRASEIGTASCFFKQMSLIMNKISLLEGPYISHSLRWRELQRVYYMALHTRHPERDLRVIRLFVAIFTAGNQTTWCLCTLSPHSQRTSSS